MFGSTPLNFGHVTDFEAKHSTVSVWFKDNKQETVDAALASARRAVDTVGVGHEGFRVRMTSRFIALQQAMNVVVERCHWFIFGLVNIAIAIAIVAALAYKSFMASILLLIPVNLANLMQNAAMFHLGIGLDINATIVAVMGVGVGIDYGNYLLSRICEEYHVHEGDLGAAITTALTTTGKAIMFTAVIMLINMVLLLIVLPLVVWFFKPGFLKRTDLAVGEYVDLNQFMDDPKPVPAK